MPDNKLLIMNQKEKEAYYRKQLSNYGLMMIKLAVCDRYIEQLVEDDNLSCFDQAVREHIEQFW